MSILEPFRLELREQIGPRALLRRDRAARALFICNAPRLTKTVSAIPIRLQSLGYDVTEERALWRIDLAPARRVAWLTALQPAQLPNDLRLRSLCRSLLSCGDVPPADQPWPLLRQTLLYADSGEWDALYHTLSAAVAQCKRTHTPLPSSAAYLIESAYCTEVNHADLSSRSQ